MGLRTKSWTGSNRSGREVRMYDRGKVELVLSLLSEGATPGRAAREAGVSRTTARNCDVATPS